jgi:IS5 family transposase
VNLKAYIQVSSSIKINLMREEFQVQLTLGKTPIPEVKIPLKANSHMANLIAALQYIYVNPEWNRRIFKLLKEDILENKKATGRPGMNLWEMFVLAQVRLCMNVSYDNLHYMANYDLLLRGVLGVLPTDYSHGKEYEYQNIYDNVTLIEEKVLKKINDTIVEIGHEVFKKKESSPLRLKTDSFVVETETHFPTDYNLLWDSARKCIAKAKQLEIPGWRKAGDWEKKLKGLMRQVGRVSGGGGKNKEERLKVVAKAYIGKSNFLKKKVEKVLMNYSGICPWSMNQLKELSYYHEMLIKHIDLVERRIVKGEKIPHEEKVFSIFQPYVEMIKKGKRRPESEIGKKVAITTDQYNLLVDWQIAENEADSKLIIPIMDRVLTKHRVESMSVDKGFSSKENKELLSLYIKEVIMPKKGKRNQEEKKAESSRIFKRLKNKHSAIESNINELEHRGLDRCPNRTRENMNSYIGLAVTAYNLNKIGRELVRKKRKILEKTILKQYA